MSKYKKATFAAGCFWGVEAAFKKVEGVVDTRVGFTGGWKKNPSYALVCTHVTGHAEAVEVTYDSNSITYEQLLEVFWDMHDPTQKWRQGADIGPQYRSVIFYHTEEQRRIAEAAKAEKQQQYEKSIQTAIEPIETFYEAEAYHQDYYEKQTNAAC